MPTIIPTFTVVPSPTDTRQQFSANAFQLVSEWQTVIAAMNAQAGENNAAAAAALGSANDSASSADDSAASAVAAAAQVVAATNARIAAEAAAANASVTVGASKWVSGQTYAEGAAVWSELTYFTYRRRVAGAGTTDPSLDRTNWEPLIRDAVGGATLLPAGATAGVVYATHVFAGLASTVTLPASPVVGNWIGFASVASPTGSQTIGRNGNLIWGLAEDLVVDSRMPFRLVYTGPAKGWVITT